VKHFALQKNLWWILSIFGACIGELSTSDRGFLIGWITGWSVAQMIGFIDAEDRKGWLVLFIAYLIILVPIDDERYAVKWYYKLGFLALLIIGTITINNIKQTNKEKAEIYFWEKASSTKAYSDYLAKYPKGHYASEAKDSIENSFWKKASSTKAYADYLGKYPAGRYAGEARKYIENEEAKKWRTDALAWSEATSRNTSAAYKKYLELYPYGKKISQAKKRVIDKEVDEIFGGSHGILPSMDKTSYGPGSHSTISVYNNTSYTLTVRYSGNDSKIINISSHSRQSITLPNGNYRIAASVNASNVRNFAGRENLTGGSYDVKYYIKTSRY
jgi:hypothetical protein